MGWRALVGVTIGRRGADLSKDDDTSWAPVDAKRAPGADIVVDEEHGMVTRVFSGEFRADRFVDRGGADQMDALPRADIDAALASNALGLVDMDELLGLNRLRQPFRVDFPQDVIVAEFRHRGIGVNAGHDQLFRTRGRPYSEVVVV